MREDVAGAVSRATRFVASRTGMTLVEMVITVSIVGFGLFLLMGWMDSMRQDARRDLAIRMLSELDKCLARYHRSTGHYPRTSGPNAANWATAALLDHGRTREALEAFPPSLWSGPGYKNLIDPWGTPLRYHAEEDGARRDSRTSKIVRANSGRPVFESAGPDRDFGDTDPSRLGDNLRSDDPGPDVFRLQDLMQKPPTTETTTHGKEDD